MLKNPLMEDLRAKISSEDKALMDDSFALADRIYFLLKKHHITQRQLAAKLNKSESEISKWLSGGHNFTQSTLTRISLAIGERIYEIPSQESSSLSNEHLMNEFTFPEIEDSHGMWYFKSFKAEYDNSGSETPASVEYNEGQAA